jgi:hypothetical protein
VADYWSIWRGKEKQMKTIPKECLSIIGIQDDISITIKPSSIIVPIAVYDFLAASAAVYGFLAASAAGMRV